MWLVDAGAGCVEVWIPDDIRPNVVRDTLTWQAPGTARAMQLDLTTRLRAD